MDDLYPTIINTVDPKFRPHKILIMLSTQHIRSTRSIHRSGDSIWGVFLILMSFMFVAWSYFTKIKYSVFSTDQGNIFVIQDDNHDQIVQEIRSRRKAQLLDWCGEINLSNGLKYEVSKFIWLKEQEIITQEEAEQKIATIRLANMDMPKRSEEYLY